MATDLAEFSEAGKTRRVFSGVDRLGGICFGRGKTRRICRRGKTPPSFPARDNNETSFPAREKLAEFLPRTGKLDKMFPHPEVWACFICAETNLAELFRAGKTRRV